jgi:hypothetical protein
MKHFLIVLLLAWAAPIAAAQSAFLGVELDPDSELGARVVGVQQPSAASLMGIQVEDLIVGINDARMDSSASLIAGMQEFFPGELVTVHLVRGIEEIALPGILGRWPGSAKQAPASPNPQEMPLQLEFPFLSDGIWDWNQGIEFTPNWPGGMLENGFPENFVPGPIWSGERPDWMGKDWGAELQLDWQPKIQLDWQFQPPAFPQLDPIPWAVDVETQRSVKLRYPASTPEEEREALIEAAIEEYGAEVEVRFEGEGRSISIQQTQRSGSALPGVPTPPTPPVPPKLDPDDEI